METNVLLLLHGQVTVGRLFFFWLENKLQLDWNKQSGGGQRSGGDRRENQSLPGARLESHVGRIR